MQYHVSKGDSFKIKIALVPGPFGTTIPADLLPMLFVTGQAATVGPVELAEDGSFEAQIDVTGDLGSTLVIADLQGVTGAMELVVKTKDAVELMPFSSVPDGITHLALTASAPAKLVAQ